MPASKQHQASITSNERKCHYIKYRGLDEWFGEQLTSTPMTSIIAKLQTAHFSIRSDKGLTL